MNRMMRIGVDPVVRSGVMGNKNVGLAQEVYDKASPADIRDALSLVGKQLLQTVANYVRAVKTSTLTY
jgi:hypothetical protein